MERLSRETCPDAFFDAAPWADGSADARAALARAAAGWLNRRFFAVVSGLGVEPEPGAARRDAERFIEAPTHSYPWSKGGARVLLRGMGSTARAAFPHLSTACEHATEVFREVGEACLTAVERERVTSGELVITVAHPIVQVGETWEVYHSLHNDSRRIGARLPLIASFLIEESKNAGGLVIWPGNTAAATRLVTGTGDLCLLRDCIESAPDRVLYPITHGTVPAEGPGFPTRIAVILRMGLLPRTAIEAVRASGADVMSLYLDTVAGPGARARDC